MLSTSEGMYKDVVCCIYQVELHSAIIIECILRW